MKKYLGVAFFISTMSIAACSQAGAADMDRKQVEEVVKEYLLENPEIIRDAMIALEAKEEMAALGAVKTRVFNDSRDPTVGPKNAKVTIVEFFDYNCGFCKKSTDWLTEVIEGNRDDVRVIFKELPLLDGRSKTSRTAARAALAAAEQGKYWDMHVALMEQRGLTDEKIENAVHKTNCDLKHNLAKVLVGKKDYHQAEKILKELISEAKGLDRTPYYLDLVRLNLKLADYEKASVYLSLIHI